MTTHQKATLPPAFAVLDFETTGLSAANNQIIEIGAIRFDLATQRAEQLSLLVKASTRLPALITGITGITDQMLQQHGIKHQAAIVQLADFIDGLPLVAFNAGFDMGFLKRAYAQHAIRTEHSYTCALQAARKAWPELRSHRLEILARHIGLSLEGNHRAVHDCERTLSVFLTAVVDRGAKLNWRQLSTR